MTWSDLFPHTDNAASWFNLCVFERNMSLHEVANGILCSEIRVEMPRNLSILLYNVQNILSGSGSCGERKAFNPFPKLCGDLYPFRKLVVRELIRIEDKIPF